VASSLVRQLLGLLLAGAARDFSTQVFQRRDFAHTAFLARLLDGHIDLFESRNALVRIVLGSSWSSKRSKRDARCKLSMCEAHVRSLELVRFPAGIISTWQVRGAAACHSLRRVLVGFAPLITQQAADDRATQRL